MKWTGRTSSQWQTRTAWEPPDLNRISQKKDLLSQYSNPDYLLGGSTDQGLQKMAWRFQFGDAEPRPESLSPQELPAYPPFPKAPIRELEGEPLIAELEANSAHSLKFEGETPIAELPGGTFF